MADGAPGGRDGSPVLVGRAEELHRLTEALRSAPAVVLIEGEAGIGKTRLIREALRRLRDGSVRQRGARAGGNAPGDLGVVLAGACPPLREPFPYGPFFDVLRTLEGALPVGLNPVCGALRPYLPELAHRLPPAPEPIADQAAHTHRVFRAVRELLGALGRVTLVVEDLHWADDGTRDLVRFLVDAPPPGLVTVLSHRREELPRTGMPLGRAYRHPPGVTSVVMPLRPLDAEGVRSLTAELTGRPVGPALAARLLDRTAGIPFVLEETVRALPRDGDGPGPAGLDAMAVPTLLQEAMADRMASLSPSAVDIVHAAAVLRVAADDGLLTLVSGHPGEAGLDALSEALHAGVLHDHGDDRYGFRHGLAQQAVHDQLLRLDRRRLHRRAIDALAAQEKPPLVQLSYHARQAGDLPAWREYGEAAAEAARALGDTALAVELLERLLDDASLPDADRGRLAVRLSRLAMIGLTHRRSSRLLRRIVDAGDLPDAVRGEIRLNLGLLLNNQAGNHEQGRADTAAAVEELHERPDLAARALASLAMPTWGTDPLPVHQEWIRRAERLAQAHGNGALRLAVRGNHLALRLGAGDPAVRAEAEALLARPAEHAERLELARMCANLADQAAWLGLQEDAARYADQGHRLAAANRAPFLAGIIEGTALRLEWSHGRWPGLAERARHTVDIAEGPSDIRSDAGLVLGLLGAARGEWQEAADHLDAAALADPDNAPAPLLAAASGAMVRILLARGDLPAACAEAERAVARIRRKALWAWAADLVPAALTALIRAGRTADATALADEYAAGVDGRALPLGLAAVPVCSGLLARAAGRDTDAAAWFTLAEERYARLPKPYPAARCAEAAVRSRRAAAREPGAPGAGVPAEDDLDRLRSLIEEFDALGAVHDAARCRRTLRAVGVPTPSRRGRRGYSGLLSPREREVARLVATGATNRGIAETLFLSPRTVEQHVAKVLRKLDVAGRGGVAAALAVVPLPDEVPAGRA
ncbi:LuxR family transcriptional regulator [Kitasatospora sp. NE20-6]|uniref:ATP-binding protein n=1 Tax=Kitasatospora sp. NE20-6 TaxID=2859066 RepID=UPI0034DBA9E8